MTLLGGGQRRFGFATRRRDRRFVMAKSTLQLSHFSSLWSAQRAVVPSEARARGTGTKSWSMRAWRAGSGVGMPGD